MSINLRKFLLCLHPFTHLKRDGIKVPSIIPNKVSKYSGGIGDGISLRFAVKFPNCVTVKLAALSF
jgi:hypothetical protein